MRVLVTGGTGQVGHEWLAYAKKQGWEVDAPDSSTMDLRDEAASLRRLDQFKPQWVVNCAAWTDVDGAETHPEACMQLNREAPAMLSRWCRRNEARFIHYSTDYVFAGNPEDRQRYPEGYPEEAPTAPINQYGVSKRAGERAVLQEDPDALIVRLSWVCGVNGSNFLKTMLRLAAQRETIQVVNDQWGCPTWAATVPPFTSALVRDGKEGIFHLSQSGETTWYELACELFRLVGSPVRVDPIPSESYPTPAPRPRFSRLSVKRMSEATGRTPLHWRDELPELIARLRGNL